MWKINISDDLLVILLLRKPVWTFSITHALKFTKWSAIPSAHRTFLSVICRLQTIFYWLCHSVYANDEVDSDVSLNAKLLDVWEAHANQDIYILIRVCPNDRH